MHSSTSTNASAVARRKVSSSLGREKSSINSGCSQWEKNSWRRLISLQQPTYDDLVGLDKVLKTIETMPDIVNVEEILELKKQLARCEAGEAFFVQMGDCAERFDELSEEFICEKVKSITAAANVLKNILGKDCIKIGRIAGQYAKPRSSEYEVLTNGQTVPSFRGANVNTLQNRNPNPALLLEGHKLSTQTVKNVKVAHQAILNQTVSLYNLTGVSNPNRTPLVDAVNSHCPSGSLPVFTSHEGLLLNYEESVTRESVDGYFNQGAHLLWIGERTRQIDGGHVEFFRGISNPIAVKISASFDPETLNILCNRLNPGNIKGKLIVICRFGHSKIDAVLPSLILAKQTNNLNFSWSCDPMHGNTFTTSTSMKSRYIQHIIDELTSFARILYSHNEHISGVHLETSALSTITECIGLDIQEHHLPQNYTSACDPRLNLSQTLEVCSQFAQVISDLHQSTYSLTDTTNL